MNKVFKYLIAALIGYAGGVATGYIVRKKTTEIAFEEITEEEQALQMAADEPKEPIDIREEINKVFDGVPDANARPEENEGIIQLDTQKEQYFKKWKADEAMDKYDTRTKEEPEDAVVTDEDIELGQETKDFLNSIGPHEDIEAASIEDWEHWSQMQEDGPNDPEYDCVQVLWFRDDILTDEDGRPLENPGKYIGFDVKKKFEEIDEDTTGDPDIRVVYNHPKGAIYMIVRKHCDYNRKRGMEEFGGEYGGEDEYDE